MSTEQRTPVRTEQRIIASKSTIGARPTSGPGAGDDAGQGKAKGTGRKKLIVILAVVLVLGGGAGYWFLLGPGAAAGDVEAVVEDPAPVPGEVLTVEAVSLNLAGGHYLRLGLALQLTEDVEAIPDPAVALDHAIVLFSGRTVEEVSSAEGRQALKDELSAQLVEAYEGQVMGVYFTDYVTQ
jgi:flagellar FliL protein